MPYPVRKQNSPGIEEPPTFSYQFLFTFNGGFSGNAPAQKSLWSATPYDAYSGPCSSLLIRHFSFDVFQFSSIEWGKHILRIKEELDGKQTISQNTCIRFNLKTFRKRSSNTGPRPSEIIPSSNMSCRIPLPE